MYLHITNPPGQFYQGCAPGFVQLMGLKTGHIGFGIYVGRRWVILNKPHPLKRAGGYPLCCVTEVEKREEYLKKKCCGKSSACNRCTVTDMCIDT